jgi:transposase
MNWGNNLTLIGAIDQQGWVALGTQWTAATSESFVAWVRDRLAPKLRAGDIVVLDNLRAHQDPRVRRIIHARGARLRFLPPYSYDYNPIESAWALLKKAHPCLRPAHRRGPPPRGPRGASRGQAASFSPVVRACRVRQLKY